MSSDSDFWTDTERRKEVFQRSIHLWGLERHLAIETREEAFVITAVPPLQLRYLFQREGNLNPTEVRVMGLSSVDAAIAATKSARDGISQKVIEASFGCNLTSDQYSESFDQFNSLLKPWQLEVRGTITDDTAAILDGGEVTDASPSWVPAFRWWEEEVGAKVYGSVIIENGERYLEIATDGGTLELLRDRVAFLNGLRFHQVYP
jgi:hypothetical protein